MKKIYNNMNIRPHGNAATNSAVFYALCVCVLAFHRNDIENQLTHSIYYSHIWTISILWNAHSQKSPGY